MPKLNNGETGEPAKRLKSKQRQYIPTNEEKLPSTALPDVGTASTASYSRDTPSEESPLDFGDHVVGNLARFLTDYIVLPDLTALVIAAWIVAAWMIETWDRFPHLAISSPTKRCGKTTLLELIFQVVRYPRLTTNISAAALYRVIEQECPTLLMDESQSLARKGSEQSEVLREILNAGISKNAKVIRCGGADMDSVQEFSVFSPKVFAAIGQPDEVLADRSISVELRRKTASDPKVKRFRWRAVENAASELKEEIEQWADSQAERAARVYDGIEPFEIENDRMADLLTPLQTVLLLLKADEQLAMLRAFADSIDERDREEHMQSDGVRLLIAIREIFEKRKKALKEFIPTEVLLQKLETRVDEPWATFTRGRLISREKLASLLREYGVKPSRIDKKVAGKTKTVRGYRRDDFEDTWHRYCP